MTVECRLPRTFNIPWPWNIGPVAPLIIPRSWNNISLGNFPNYSRWCNCSALQPRWLSSKPFPYHPPLTCWCISSDKVPLIPSSPNVEHCFRTRPLLKSRMYCSNTLDEPHHLMFVWLCFRTFDAHMLYVSEICATLNPHRSCPTGGFYICTLGSSMYGCKHIRIWPFFMIHYFFAMFGVVSHAIVCDFSKVWL